MTTEQSSSSVPVTTEQSSSCVPVTTEERSSSVLVTTQEGSSSVPVKTEDSSSVLVATEEGSSSVLVTTEEGSLSVLVTTEEGSSSKAVTTKEEGIVALADALDDAQSAADAAMEQLMDRICTHPEFNISQASMQRVMRGAFTVRCIIALTRFQCGCVKFAETEGPDRKKRRTSSPSADTWAAPADMQADSQASSDLGLGA